MAELCTSCQQLRGKLDSLAAEAEDQDSALGGRRGRGGGRERGEGEHWEGH